MATEHSEVLSDGQVSEFCTDTANLRNLRDSECIKMLWLMDLRNTFFVIEFSSLYVKVLLQNNQNPIEKIDRNYGPQHSLLTLLIYCIKQCDKE
jgi:hypothetical protein